jgi:hypothetical protein
VLYNRHAYNTGKLTENCARTPRPPAFAAFSSRLTAEIRLVLLYALCSMV